MSLKSPKKTKYKSPHFRLEKKGLKGIKVSQNSLTIKSKETCLLTPKHYEASRRILAKTVREEKSSLNVRFFPDLSLTKKPLQTRMGKGKGNHDKWVAPVNSGNPLFEINGLVPLKVFKKLYKRVAFRLPVYSKLLVKGKREKNVFINNKILKIK